MSYVRLEIYEEKRQSVQAINRKINQTVFSKKLMELIDKDTMHLIIDFLNPDDQHRLEQTCHWQRDLLLHPAHRDKRIKLRAKGSYETVSRQLELAKSFLSDAENEMEQKSYFSHRRMECGRQELKSTFIILLLITSLILNAIFFSKTVRKRNQIIDQMDNTDLFTWKDTRRCSSVADTVSGCNLVNEGNNAEKCLRLCKQIDELSPDLGGTIAGMVLSFLPLLIHYFSSWYHGLRGSERFEAILMRQFSPDLQQKTRDILIEYPEDAEFSQASLQTNIGFFKNKLSRQMPELEEKKLALENKLKTYQQKRG